MREFSPAQGPASIWISAQLPTIKMQSDDEILVPDSTFLVQESHGFVQEPHILVPFSFRELPRVCNYADAIKWLTIVAWSLAVYTVDK